MRISTTFVFTAIMLYGISSQIAISQKSNLSIPQNAILVDPNLNPNWDWRLGDDPSRIYPDAAYTMYYKSEDTQIRGHFVDGPWAQPANANAGLGDNKKEDGWEIIARDFGTPTRAIMGIATDHPPYFLLFNKYRSISRIFIYAQNSETWNKGFVEIKFQNPSDPTKTPAVLAHFKPIADAIDKFQNMKDNVNSVFSNVLQKNVWLWADFPFSYDPTITPKSSIDPPRLYLTVFGQQLSEIGLKGVAQGAQGKANFVNDWLTGSGQNFGNGSVGIPNLSMPNINLGDLDVDLGKLSLKPFGTFTSWKGFSNSFGKIKIPSVKLGNPLKGLFDGFGAKLSSFAGILPIGLPGLDIGGIYDFFVNGGAKAQTPAEPAPSYIAMNLEFTGKITKTLPVHFFQITIPGTRDEYWKPTWGNPVGIVRNDLVGILTITKTPVIYKKYYEEFWYQENTPGGVTTYTIPFTEYEIGEDIQLSVNPASGLELSTTKVELVIDYLNIHSYATSKITDWCDLRNQKHLVNLECPIDENSASFRTMTAPLKYAKGRTLQLPSGSESNGRIKLTAVLKRKDDPNAQPVVFISTYNVDVIENWDRPTNQNLPTIPPQNVIVTVPVFGGVIVSWDRNLERNVNLYAVERSINGAPFVQIGTTKDTVFTDAEVQKAVKPYRSNRQNVSVNYRVKAKSEWLDENSNWQSQYSAYSDVSNISGSIIGVFAKSGTTQIIPESNSLSQNFPNPFNPSTTIYYGLKEAGNVTIKIYNALGQEIVTLVNERKESGYHYAEWNASGLPSGMYFYKIQSGNYTESKKMLLTK